MEQTRGMDKHESSKVSLYKNNQEVEAILDEKGSKVAFIQTSS